jgi:mannose-1-phosphate guanylyltransferase
VLPADPHIGDEAAFETLVRAAITEATNAIVTIGISPTHPETGFGYIRLGAARPTIADVGTPAGVPVFDVGAFVEKPDRATALRYLAAGDYLWNSGMFFLTARRLLEETRRHMPTLGTALDAMIAATDFDAKVRELYPTVPAISIDYGLMEKAAGIRVIPGAFGWNDVGSWAALHAIRRPDARGNVVVGDATLLDGDGSVVLAEAGAPFVGVVGVRDVVVIATADAVLVIPKDRAQDVRLIVEAVKKAGREDLI